MRSQPEFRPVPEDVARAADLLGRQALHALQVSGEVPVGKAQQLHACRALGDRRDRRRVDQRADRHRHRTTTTLAGAAQPPGNASGALTRREVYRPSRAEAASEPSSALVKRNGPSTLVTSARSKSSH